MQAKIIAISIVLLLNVSIVGTINLEKDISISKDKKEVIDAFLKEKLTNANETDKLEIIVQFTKNFNKEDKEKMEKLGFKVKHYFHAINGVYAIGNKNAIYELSKWNKVKWIEFNEQLTYFMDITTTVINATDVWDRQIKDKANGTIEGIDGKGVTVVIIDTGIDAGHPDLDYGRKVIKNLKSDSNLGWYETENSDTSSGHGTHVAGTVAGNGDASAESRRGVAPGAWLIGLSTGELFSIINAIGALEWVYDNSRPNANPYNIRVTSNSWGTSGGEYDPNDGVTKITEKLAFENNVVSIFAGGNDGGDGSDLRTNPYSNTPVVIGVAAGTHDGKGIATFSSRGQADQNETWPDITAPGVKVWATKPSNTIIDVAVTIGDILENEGDFWYMAISGTSMATPHVSGLVALLFQAAPSLRISDIHEDYSGKGEDYQAWINNNNTRIHEVELILELTSEYILPSADNGVPTNSSIGHDNRSYDFAQGYGLINAREAVALALSLEEMRKTNKNATVYDAYKKFKNIQITELTTENTNVIKSYWQGEWTRYHKNGLRVEDTVSYLTNQTHYAFIPAEASTLIIDLSYEAIKIESSGSITVSSLRLEIDANDDGNPDYMMGFVPSTTGQKHEEIDLNSGTLANERGKSWKFDIRGDGVDTSPIGPLPDPTLWYTARVEYDISIQLVFNSPNTTITFKNLYAINSQYRFGQPTTPYHGESITMLMNYYDLNNIKEEEKEIVISEEKKEFPYGLLLLAVIILGALSGIYLFVRGRKKF